MFKPLRATWLLFQILTVLIRVHNALSSKCIFYIRTYLLKKAISILEMLELVKKIKTKSASGGLLACSDI